MYLGSNSLFKKKAAGKTSDEKQRFKIRRIILLIEDK